MAQCALQERKTPLSMLSLLETLEALEVTWRVDGDQIAVRGPSHVLTDALRAAIAEHKPALLELAATRAEFLRIVALIERLRCEDPKKGTRADALAYVKKLIEKFRTTRCDLMNGYSDPVDPFAAEVLATLHYELQDLMRSNEYPLGPLPEDPFENGRRYNGKSLRRRLHASGKQENI